MRVPVAIKKLLPSLAITHPGFFKVTLAMILLHIGIGLDHIFLRHVSVAWYYVKTDFGGVETWGFINLVIAAVMIFGLYAARRAFVLVRLMYAMSVSVFALFMGSFVAAYFKFPDQVSLYTVGFQLFAIIISMAALTEPEINPASQKVILHVDDLAG